MKKEKILKNIENQKALSEKAEVTLSSELLFDGRIVRLYHDTVRLPDGAVGDREYVRHIGGVCVLPLDADGQVTCVRQYRYPFGEVLTELPAGKLDQKDEDRALAALRELREETGYRCEKLTFLGKFYSSPAILDEVIGLYLAEGLTAGEMDLDEDEFLSNVRYPLSVLVDEVQKGNIPDGKSQAAILRTAELLRRRAEEKQ